MDELRGYNKEDMATERRKSLKRYVEDENMSVDRLRKVSRDRSCGVSTQILCWSLTKIASLLPWFFRADVGRVRGDPRSVKYIIVRLKNT